MSTTNNAVLYLRSSKDTHDVSPAAQRTELREFAGRKKLRIVGEFKDAAISANDNPPDLARLLTEVEKNPDRGWNVILAIDSSRIARDTDLAGVISYKVREAGCRIEYSKQPSSANAAMDILVASVMRGIDAFHSLTSKQKGLAGMKTNVERGHRAGGRAPLGYKLQHTETGAMRQGSPVRKSKLVLDKPVASRVKKFLLLRAGGARRTDAARKSGLSDKTATTLISVERNALTYAGVTVWNRLAETGPQRYRPREEWVFNRGTHPALIDEATAERIMQQALPAPERGAGLKRGPAGTYLLTHLLVTPSGERFQGTDGGAYYRTASKGKRIPAAALEAVVLDQVNEDTAGHEFIDRFIREARRAAAAIPSDADRLKAERRRAAKEVDNLLKLAERAPDSPALADRLKEREAELARVDAAIARSATTAHLKASLAGLSAKEVKQWLQLDMEREGQTVEERRAALAQLVERVELDPATGRGKIHYRLPLGQAGKFDLRTFAEIGGLVASPRGFEPRFAP